MGPKDNAQLPVGSSGGFRRQWRLRGTDGGALYLGQQRNEFISQETSCRKLRIFFLWSPENRDTYAYFFLKSLCPRVLPMSSVKTSHNPWGGSEELRDKEAKGSSALPPSSSTKTAGGRNILHGPQKSQHLGIEGQGEVKHTGEAGDMSSKAHVLGRSKAQNMAEPQSSTLGGEPYFLLSPSL